MIETSGCHAIDQFVPVRPVTSLPLQTCLFPMGYPIRIATNSVQVLETASRLWSAYPQLFDRPAVRFDIVVASESTAPESTANVAPRYTNRDHLLSIVTSQNSYAIADLRAGSAFASIPESLTMDELRYYYLEPVVYVLVAARQFAFVHASCVALNGQAVLLCGDSGAGKTCLAFACAKRGWTFVTGDAAAIVREDPDCRVIGRPYEIRFRESARDLFPELRGLAPAMRPNGKADIEVSPQQLRLNSALEARVTHLVFLERTHRICAAIEPYSQEEARRRLESAICFGDEANRQEQRHTLAKLLQLPVFSLQYSDPDVADEVLRSILERR